MRIETTRTVPRPAATAVEIAGRAGLAGHALVAIHEDGTGWHEHMAVLSFRTLPAAQRVADAINEAVDMDRSPMREAAE
jgi:hypothetical protein